jgi:hypothetical protein
MNPFGWIVGFRIPILCLAASLAISLTLLFVSGIILPGWISSLLWIATAIIAGCAFRAHNVSLLSLSGATIALYLYASLALFWPVLFPQVKIAVRATAFQTADIFAKANHLVAIGLAAMLSGWLVAFDARARRARPSRRRYALVTGDAFLPLILLAFPLLVLSFPTESIFTTAYSGAPRETTIGATIEINVLKPALLFCVILALIALLQNPTRIRKIVWGALFLLCVVVLGFASGSRVEELGCLMAVGWILLTHRGSRRLPKRWIVVGACLAYAMLVLGEVRSVLSSHSLNSGLLIDASRRAVDIFPANETLTMKPSTNGDIAATLCVVIGLVETGILQVDYGETFVKYIWMTLPRFLNPDRPVELQVFLQQLAMTGGGLFVLAEPFLAGGSAGVLLLMLLFGYIIGSLEARSVRGELAPMACFLYLGLLSCAPRWFLYSNLSMYKHMLTGIIIVVLARLLSSIFVSESRRPTPALSHS